MTSKIMKHNRLTIGFSMHIIFAQQLRIIKKQVLICEL